MSKHDLKARQLQVEEIISVIVANPIIISSLLRYNNANTFSNPQDIVDKNYVDNLFSGSGVITQILDETSLIPNSGDPDTDYNLPITLAAGQVVIGVRVLITGGDDFNLPINYKNNVLYGFANNLPQTIIIKIA